MSHKKKSLGSVEKLSFACGAVPFGIAYLAMAQLAYPIFNMTLGMSATMIGLAMAVGRLWDAFSDPFMGSFSDNSRTRWGRRRPFILLGGLLCAFAFPLVFFVPVEASPAVHFSWLLVATLLFFTAATVFSVPWLSLGYEITADHVERVSVHAYRAYLAGAVALTLPWVYRLAQSDAFESTISGMRSISLLMSLAFVAFSLPVFFFCKERFFKRAHAQQKVPFFKALKQTMSNRPFLILVLGVVTSMLCGPMLVGSLGVYVNVYHVFEGDSKLGASYAALGASLMVVVKYIIIPMTQALAARFGKIKVVRGALCLGLIGSIGKFFFYTPEHPALQFAVVLLLGPAFTSFWILADPLKADCTDFDEYKTGLRREGSYAAAANWIEKTCITLVVLLSGIFIDISGFDPALGYAQPENAMLILRAAFAGVPAIAFLVALVSLHFYPLKDSRMRAIRRCLERRRGHVD